MALHRLDQLLARGIGAGLLDRLVDEVHPVVAAERVEVRPHPVVGLHEGFDVRLVLRRIVRGRVVERRDDADRRRAHALEQVVVGDVAGADEPDAGLLQAALVELLHHREALAGGHEHEQRVGLRVLRALQERRVVGVAQRRLDRLDDLAARRLEHRHERLFGVEPRAVVGDHRDDALDLVLRGPLGDRRP